MTVSASRIFADTYVDSVVALRSMRAMREIDGVEWATAVMATPANIADLASEGVTGDDISAAGANDFCLAVRADDDDGAAAALAAGADAAFAAHQASGDDAVRAPRSIRSAMEMNPDTNVAVISVAGEYATLAAFQALGAGLHVLLFSDNVPLQDEIALKQYARRKGVLLMGPDAGTAMLGGIGLGFANAVSPGRVGIVAAAGTGAQEVMALLDRWGVGVSHVIGVGGRDLSTEVGGLMAIAAMEALAQDPDTEAILLVSKPPAPEVAHRVVEAAGGKPVIATLLGLDAAHFDVPESVTLAATLETGVLRTIDVLGEERPDVDQVVGPSPADSRGRIGAERTTVRGLFSGGTLCYESQVILGDVLGPIYSNTPIDKDLSLPAPPGSHQCLDLGADEYTHNRPHPMIDAEARIEVMREHLQDPSVAVIILDVVLGHGSNPDPAGVLAPVCAEAMQDGGPQVVAYVLGTEMDPQQFTEQRRKLTDAGCIVTETAARASLVAAALITGDDDLVGKELP